ncbi:hypothetical protein TWF696_007942 [Orbilia brochopaga]|uniref:Uncharacterized protein n=1 Tax=Orbilia brochopaga TaxID=3140254 RepID=A0AAV9UQ20_9PEZI
MSFESDDTNAKADSTAFAKAMREMFGLIDANVFEVVFPEDMDPFDYWAFNIMGKISQVRSSCIGRKLMILHFAGHGALDDSNRLLLEGNPTGHNQCLPWDIIEAPFRPYMKHPYGEVDVACVLDCCYPGAFNTPSASPGRTVEVLAATDARSTIAARALQDIGATFTQRFIFEMRSIVADKGKPPVTFPDILKKMQNRKREPSKSPPVYRTLYGDAPILLPVTSLQRSPAPSIDTTDPLALDFWRPEEHSVALKAHLPTSINDDSTRTIVKWLHQLQKDYKVEVMGVHDTNSAVVFLTVPYANLYILYRLEQQGLCKVDVICENLYSLNLLDTFVNSENTGVTAAPTVGSIESK